MSGAAYHREEASIAASSWHFDQFTRALTKLMAGVVAAVTKGERGGSGGRAQGGGGGGRSRASQLTNLGAAPSSGVSHFGVSLSETDHTIVFACKLAVGVVNG